MIFITFLLHLLTYLIIILIFYYKMIQNFNIYVSRKYCHISNFYKKKKKKNKKKKNYIDKDFYITQIYNIICTKFIHVFIIQFFT